LARNIYNDDSALSARRLADYVRTAVHALAQQDADDFVRGLRFPDAAEIVAV
jgi:hypothetical protein